jgi:hypothetical protein
MKFAFTLLLAILFTVRGFGQCVNQRLFPEPSPDYSVTLQRSVSMFDRYLAVGVANSDTVGRNSVSFISMKRKMTPGKKLHPSLLRNLFQTLA